MKKVLPIFLLLAALLYWCGCFEENFITDPSATPTFSVDTLRFDTVFTERGSATLTFRIYNPFDDFLRIDKIEIRNQQSFFRLNVDGFSGNSLSDIEIPPNDSTWGFVEVLIDPDQPLSVSPFIIEDQIHFTTNGNEQLIQLEAFGQNANYVPFLNATGEIRGFSGCDFQEIILDDPKPYVFFGIFVVDSCELVIPAGARVYIHGGLARVDDGDFFGDGILFVGTNGTLRVEGTADNPVLIQGDRLEPRFNVDTLFPERGQWSRIQLGPGSRNNIIEHAIIRNGTIGVFVDSSAQLTMRNTQLYNHSSAGLVGRHAAITAENCLIANNGVNDVLMLYGGIYSYEYCTIAAFAKSIGSGASIRANNFQCVDDECDEVFINPLRLDLKNSIVTGNGRDEFQFEDAAEDDRNFTYRIVNSIVKVDELLEIERYANFLDEPQCTNCLEHANEPLFLNPAFVDFHLDSLTIAEMNASPIVRIPTDLEGNLRDVQTPDIGCYERIE